MSQTFTAAAFLRTSRFFVFVLCVIHSPFLAGRAQAYSHSFSSSIPAEVLSETSPFAFPPNDFTAEDFSVVWQSEPLAGVAVTIGKESLEWVRTGEVFLLPRGRLLLEVKGVSIEAAQVKNLGFAQPMAADGHGNFSAQIPIPLLSSQTGSSIEVQVKRNGKVEVGYLGVVFSPRKERLKAISIDERVVTDANCSPSSVRPSSETQLASDQWAYVGCRYIMAWGDEYSVAGLDTFIYWAGAVGKVQADGIELVANPPGIFLLRLRSSPGVVTLRDEAGNQMRLTYKIPDRQRYGNIGFGLGPYLYQYQDRLESTQTVTPLLTLYGSVYFSELFRVVAFNATSFSPRWFSDTGIYLQTDNFRILDKRIQMKLLFGAQTRAFYTPDGAQGVFGGPQGFELIIPDFFAKGRNLTGGAFIYPLINGKKYINSWIRWGSNKVFGEINYIDWQEMVGGNSVGSSSIGLTVGAPLFQFY
jgi:hypothetical protein